MCGIAGHLGKTRLPTGRIQRGLDLMRRRGPDDRASAHLEHGDRHVDLLATRLRIIDLDPRSNQPFRLGTKTLIFNGELYNYKELRVELEEAGTRFHTHSDTEVLIAAIDRWGWAALDRFEGMWAFALFDSADGSFALCRDRFGEKPLYFYQDHGDLYFGSQVKAVAALAGRSFEIDRDHVRRFLAHGYRTLHKTDRTFFVDVEAVPPATLIRFAADGTRITERYWRPRFEPDATITYEEAVQGVHDRLQRAVRLRLRADVPVAFCLSGGVDSSSLASIAKKELGYEAAGFTIANDDPRYDEREAVGRMVRELRMKHTMVPVSHGRFLENLRELVRYHDAPVSTITSYMQWLLLGAVKAAGFRVAVSGTGADELLTGYYDSHLAYLHEVRTDPGRHRQALAEWQATVLPFVRSPELRDPELYTKDPGYRHHLYLEGGLFSSFLKQPLEEPFEEEHFTDSLLRNRMLNELFHEVVPVILHEEDLNAMYHSVENRSPFLDRELFEFCYRIPNRLLIRDGRAKAILRDAVKGIVPEHVRVQPRKIGFNASIQSFLDASDAAVRAAALADGPIFEIVDRQKVENLMDKPQLTDAESKFLFCFLSAKIFLEEFGAGP